MAHIVAPNKFHHLFVEAWSERFPSAKAWADAPLQARRNDFRFDGTLETDTPVPWRDEIEQVHFAGSNVLSEFVFFHSASRTLIITDIIQNHEPGEDSWFWRGVKKLVGVLAPKGGAPRDWRLTVRDREAAREARDRILDWDFDRLIISHGRCLTSDAKAFFRESFRWLG